MSENARQEVVTQKPRMAICYDFDKTLSPDDMQSFTLIPSLGMRPEDFWPESNQLAKDNLMDNNLAWMYQLVVKSKALRKPLSRSYFNQVGKDVPLYNGVDTWFERVNQYGEENGIEVHHYIISSGLKEIIEGSNIAQYFSRVYASSYLYSADGVAEWPAQAVNYTNKTQFIFRIAKGIFEEYDERVNDSVPESALVTPYENIVYIGDSATDIPCMRLVKSKGGYSIGVFDPEKNKREKVYQLFNDGRINFYAPADYSEDSELFKYIKLVIGQISINEGVKTEQRTLKNPAETYNLYSSCEILLGAQQNLTVFDAYVDNDTVQEHLDDFYKTVSAEDQVLLCSDLYGGSVNQSMYPYLQKPNTRLVSGVNMTFMMNVLCEEELSDERLEEILEESRSYLRRVNLETNETEDESFF